MENKVFNSMETVAINRLSMSQCAAKRDIFPDLNSKHSLNTVFFEVHNLVDKIFTYYFSHQDESCRSIQKVIWLWTKIQVAT
jgi:hypothetical protein